MHFFVENKYRRIFLNIKQEDTVVCKRKIFERNLLLKNEKFTRDIRQEKLSLVQQLGLNC